MIRIGAGFRLSSGHNGGGNTDGIGCGLGCGPYG
jgi:hypothetical protein